MSMVDIRGIRRGKCKLCSCDGFTSGKGVVHCTNCHHSPVQHLNLTQQQVDPVVAGITVVKTAKVSVQDSVQDEADVVCALHPKCTNSAYFDVNTGESSVYCEEHLDYHSQPTAGQYNNNPLNTGFTLKH